MAARTTDTAASLSPDRTVFSCFLSCKSQCFCTYSSRLTVLKRAYNREFLLDVGRTTFLELNSAHAEEESKLQEQGEPPGRVVQGQQSLSECGEDEGDCCWLQESAHSACSSDHQRCDCGESEQHQVPGCAHHRGPLLDQQHCGTGQESTAASPQTQKSQSPDPHHVHLLQRHHREHPD